MVSNEFLGTAVVSGFTISWKCYMISTTTIIHNKVANHISHS